MIPAFQKREIVIEKGTEDPKLGSGGKECVGIVKYKGKDVRNYEEGDKILYDPATARLEIKYFGTSLLRIENEDYVICKIIENE